ncbi:MAG: PAS domain-containing sensor histidine kinase [Candidatus Omnitrophica bacterium]|nr:PAS domain-containing sensor histidine kinase [Candidatus Omnitrophota bacterium]
MSAEHGFAQSSNGTSDQRFQMLMQGLECGVIILHPDLCVADMNPAAEILLGSSRNLIVGMSWTDLVKRNQLDTESRYRIRAVPSMVKDGERVLLIEDLTGGGVRGAIQSDFVASVSHELRTPMAIIREGMSQIREGLLGGINEDQKKFLDLSLHNADRLDKILRALLDVSIIQSGRLILNKSIVALPEVMREACVFFQQMVRQKGLSLAMDLPQGDAAPIYADRAQLLKAVAHLIDNAIKFTPDGDIRCGIDITGTSVRVWVADRGAGLTPEERLKIFEKFSQFGRVAGSGAKGLGLGLAVVKGIVEAHGGSVSADARSGGGSIFSIYLNDVGDLASFRRALTEAIARASVEDNPVTAVVIQPAAGALPAVDLNRVQDALRQELKGAEYQVSVVNGSIAILLYGVTRPQAGILLGEAIAALKDKGILILGEERARFVSMPEHASSAEEMLKYLDLESTKETSGG